MIESMFVRHSQILVNHKAEAASDFMLTYNTIHSIYVYVICDVHGRQAINSPRVVTQLMCTFLSPTQGQNIRKIKMVSHKKVLIFISTILRTLTHNSFKLSFPATLIRYCILFFIYTEILITRLIFNSIFRSIRKYYSEKNQIYQLFFSFLLRGKE